MSDREAEILRQQRLVAARLTGSSLNGAAAKPAPSASKQASIVQKNTQRKQLKSVLIQTETSTAAKSNKRPQKRPTMRNKLTSPPMTAAAAIAAAKSRVANTAAISKVKESTNNVTATIDSNDPVKRKTLQLAQLVSASKKTSDQPAIVAGSFGPIEPGDFWKHMRDWDVLTQLVQTKAAKQQQDDASPTSTKKPLPETFVSHGHYMAAWAPLCLAEARAQMVSDASTYTNRIQFVPVTAKTVTKDGSTLDSMRVQVSRKNKKDDLQFMPNDLVLLIPEKSKEQVEGALKGNSTESLRKHGLVGHTEFRRDSIDGLLLRVSKRWWATLGQKDMYLWKLGSNITAVREFSALCRVESLPLKRYILGEHLVDNAHKTAAAAHNKNKHAMLDAMGGTNALGKGFIKYVQNKFNPSQLAAISAAAEEYGDGGFTLCKGRT